MSDKVKFHFSGPEESPGYLLAQLTILWQRNQKKVLDPLELTHTQFVILSSIAWLSSIHTTITQVEIARFNNYDRMMVSKVLRTLQTKKLIERKEHATDTRAKIVNLTSKGSQILQKAIVQVENADIDFFSSLGSNLPNLNKSMKKLIEAHRSDNSELENE
ncbi:hypothetical protein GCM10011506_08990 [Marivirga lumbricoides]|uniref:MarR family transcriptional regulator n=1 Tax=Marivirga lumbricoides TaxID=1046115 RepID=A0A2T4DHE7_9BACT|nr:MarR family transcriptional regulator [Marivirga lumbricoides]GGC25816.1 hypothetical protein GCM10011506_08990 [Marivirga lumbricoides]